MDESNGDKKATELMSTLPGDDVRQIMWRFEERYEFQMIVQSARSIARGVVARLVAEGARNSHEWNDKKALLLTGFDEIGLTTVFMDPEEGGFIEGPKNLALALVAFELSWVDGGAATCSLASNLALSPIHEKGTPEQKYTYMSRCVPPLPGEDRKVWRGAFALTEPLPSARLASCTTGCEGRNGARCFATPIGPTPGPPPPCGMQNVLCRLR
jgi:alkylation response protein AidB-like acyl-CoA dehydrogenase